MTPTESIARAGDDLMRAAVKGATSCPTCAESYDKMSAARRRCDLLELENARLRDVLAISRGWLHGFADFEPSEVCKDEFAYDRLLSTFRQAVRSALVATDPEQKGGRP